MAHETKPAGPSPRDIGKVAEKVGQQQRSLSDQARQAQAQRVRDAVSACPRTPEKK